MATGVRILYLPPSPAEAIFGVGGQLSQVLSPAWLQFLNKSGYGGQRPQ